jgi:hypothetical protein
LPIKLNASHISYTRFSINPALATLHVLPLAHAEYDGAPMTSFPIDLDADPSDEGSTAKKLARLITPLFGVDQVNPTHGLIWISDYERITLKELGRGAPKPQGTIHKDEDSGDSGLESFTGGGNRAVPLAGNLPGEVTGPTLNRFGPDTKAAVYLTAANAALAPLSKDLGIALSVLIDCNLGRVQDIQLLTAWAGATLSIFRSQPLFVASALKGRTIQRAYSSRWLMDQREYSAAPAYAELDCKLDRKVVPEKLAPRSLNLIDGTILELVRALPEVSDSTSVETPTAKLARIASTWVATLLQSGVREGGDPAIYWASEPSPGHRVIQSYLSNIATIKTLLNAQAEFEGLKIRGQSEDTIVKAFLPRLPDDDQWFSLEEPQKKLLLEMVRATISLAVDKLDHGDPEVLVVEDLIGECLGRAEPFLDATDEIVLGLRVTLAQLRMNRAIFENAVRDPAPLIKIVNFLASGLRERTIDLGPGLFLMATAAVTLNRYVRNAGPIPDQQWSADAVFDLLRDYWETYFELFEEELELKRGATSAGFYLHNYAGFLSWSTRLADLHRSRSLFSRFVLPSRRYFATQQSNSRPLRISLQVAASGLARLAEKLTELGDLESSRASADEGFQLAREAIWIARADNDWTPDIPTSGMRRMASSSAKGMLAGFEDGSSANLTQAAFADLDAIISVGERWVELNPAHIEGALFSHFAELRIRMNIAKLRMDITH